jgi:hypothetical protein
MNSLVISIWWILTTKLNKKKELNWDLTVNMYLKLCKDYKQHCIDWEDLIYEDPFQIPVILFDQSKKYSQILNCLFNWHKKLYPNNLCNYLEIKECLDNYTNNAQIVFNIQENLIDIDRDLLNIKHNLSIICIII